MSNSPHHHRRPLLDALEPRRLFADVVPARGLHAEFYNNSNFVGTLRTVEGDLPNHDWGSGSPTKGIDATTFSASYSGRIQPAEDETYRFYIRTDGGVRVWIDHRLVLDDWNTLNKSRELKTSAVLDGDTPSTFRIEYRHDKGNAQLRVQWQSDKQKKQYLPASRTDVLRNETLDAIDHATAFAQTQAKLALGDLKPGAFPDRIDPKTGKWQTTSAASWVSGYFGGSLWQLNELVGADKYASSAKSWSTPLASTTNLTGDHFGRIWATYSAMYDNAKSKDRPAIAAKLLAAAKTKNGTWSSKVGAFQTIDITSHSNDRNANFGVLMDQTLDMELMLWAADHDASVADQYRSRVLQHMKTVASNMIRDDGSVVQRGFFNKNTGDLVSLENYQGLNDDSTWSRGQAWAIYSFSLIAEATSDATILAAAERVATYYLDNLPSNKVPYWDFAAPKSKSTPRDSSAAAIALNGLIRLQTIGSSNPIKQRAALAVTDTFASLLSGNFLVEGLKGNEKQTYRGLLAHGSSHVPRKKGVDTAQTYGDYYLLLAMNAFKK